MSDTFESLGIELRGNNNTQKVSCPKCKEAGKKSKDRALSVNIIDGLYNCHRCGWSGKLQREKKEYYTMEREVIEKPDATKLKSLDTETIEWLGARCISKETAVKNRVSSTVRGGNVSFNYFKNNKLVNYKMRGFKEKFFFQASNAEQVMYNHDNITKSDSIIVCEGEMDSLSWSECGVDYHTSVSQGAPNVNDSNVDKKLACVSNCFRLFDNAKTIYIGVDEDDNGRNLEKELIRRFGAEKCKIISYEPWKDANEVLCEEGKESLLYRLKTAESVKLEGVFTASDIKDSLIDGYLNGQERGTTTYVHQIDKAWTWRPSEVNTWTGYQNEGKSLFLTQLSLLKSFYDGWKFAVFSPENMPMNDFYNDLIECYIGKSADPFYKDTYMSIEEYEEGFDFVSKHFFLIYPKRDFSMETIFEKTKFLVKTKGVRGLIIDPYNTIEHKSKTYEKEHQYISRFMSELKRFTIDYDLSTHLVAHQVTPENISDKGEVAKYPKPNLNKIKGGGTFADKSDNVCYVQRPDRFTKELTTNVVFGSQKIKKQKLVGIPQDVVEIEFNIKTQRYEFNGVSPFEEVDRIRKSRKI